MERNFKTLSGVVRGRMIELAESPGLPEGEEVEIVLRRVSRERDWGDGLRRAGAFAADWSPEGDRILKELEQERRPVLQPS